MADRDETIDWLRRAHELAAESIVEMGVPDEEREDEVDRARSALAYLGQDPEREPDPVRASRAAAPPEAAQERCDAKRRQFGLTSVVGEPPCRACSEAGAAAPPDLVSAWTARCGTCGAETKTTINDARGEVAAPPGWSTNVAGTWRCSRCAPPSPSGEPRHPLAAVADQIQSHARDITPDERRILRRDPDWETLSGGERARDADCPQATRKSKAPGCIDHPIPRLMCKACGDAITSYLRTTLAGRLEVAEERERNAKRRLEAITSAASAYLAARDAWYGWINDKSSVPDESARNRLGEAYDAALSALRSLAPPPRADAPPTSSNEE